MSVRKAVYHGSGVIVAAGLTLALWPLGQSAYGYWSQHQLRAQWETAAQTRATAPALPQPPSNPKSTIRNPQFHYPAWPPTRLVIPDLNLDVVVVQGIQSWNLRNGPGHYPNSALPGQAGNCVIAGHRNIYGSWFYDVNQLVSGAPIILITPIHTYTYHMLSQTTISDEDTTIVRPLADPGEARLTIITCTMPHSEARVAVTADLVDTS